MPVQGNSSSHVEENGQADSPAGGDDGSVNHRGLNSQSSGCNRSIADYRALGTGGNLIVLEKIETLLTINPVPLRIGGTPDFNLCSTQWGGSGQICSTRSNRFPFDRTG